MNGIVAQLRDKKKPGLCLPGFTDKPKPVWYRPSEVWRLNGLLKWFATVRGGRGGSLLLRGLDVQSIEKGVQFGHLMRGEAQAQFAAAPDDIRCGVCPFMVYQIFHFPLIEAGAKVLPQVS